MATEVQEIQRKFTWVNSTVTKNQVVACDCNTIVLWNQGTSIVYIDAFGGLQLNPPDTTVNKEGIAYSFPGEAGELNDGSFQVIFVGGSGKLVVSRKIYHL